MFFSKSFIVCGLTFSFNPFWVFFMYDVRSVLVPLFYMQLTSFPSTVCYRDCLFSIVYFVSFVTDKVSIGAWIYFWAFYFVPLIYISVFCKDHVLLMTVALSYNLMSGSLIPSVSFLFLKVALAIWGFFLCLNTNCEVIWSSSVRNTIDSLIGIVLNL